MPRLSFVTESLLPKAFNLMQNLSDLAYAQRWMCIQRLWIHSLFHLRHLSNLASEKQNGWRKLLSTSLIWAAFIRTIVGYRLLCSLMSLLLLLVLLSSLPGVNRAPGVAAVVGVVGIVTVGLVRWQVTTWIAPLCSKRAPPTAICIRGTCVRDMNNLVS